MRSFPTIVFSLASLGPCLLAGSAIAQDVSSRTDVFQLAEKNSDLPIINWISPATESTYQSETTYNVRFDLSCSTPIKAISISLKNEVNSKSRTTQKIELDTKLDPNSTVEFEVDLEPGANVIEIIAENADGATATSYKTIHVGSAIESDVRDLNRTDYAIIFATDQYDNWPDLVNPVYDARAIGSELENTYGFKVEVVENATQNDILKKIRDYIGKDYKPLDQLFIFFAGHGNYDQTFGEGYLVPREALINDEGKTSYLSYHRLRSVVNNIPCEHIFLTMDVCFGGTFDEELASTDTQEAGFGTKMSAEIVTKRLSYKTRKFMTSGEKQYVSDGIPGKHSPFARALLEAFRSSGGEDGILTLREITPYVSKLKIRPTAGEFGDNAPGSDFIFVSR
jgi:hypothetical protein